MKWDIDNSLHDARARARPALLCSIAIFRDTQHVPGKYPFCDIYGRNIFLLCVLINQLGHNFYNALFSILMDSIFSASSCMPAVA
eukprot:c25334_g1_i1 orf=150-404(-)